MSSNNQYAVVSFDEKEVAVVPMHWLNEDENQCWWPQDKSKESGNVTTYIKRSLPPSKNWKQLSVRVLGKASKYLPT